jgi:group I intron endonuclease
LKTGYSSLGYKHTQETRDLLSKLAKNRVHTSETKALITQALTGENNPFYNKNHSMETKIRMMEARSSYPVYIYDSKKVLLVIVPSAKSLAKLCQSTHGTIVTYIKDGNLFRGE